MSEPAEEAQDPRTIARQPTHLSGGEQDRQGPFDFPPAEPAARAAQSAHKQSATALPE